QEVERGVCLLRREDHRLHVITATGENVLRGALRGALELVHLPDLLLELVLEARSLGAREPLGRHRRRTSHSRTGVDQAERVTHGTSPESIHGATILLAPAGMFA